MRRTPTQFQLAALCLAATIGACSSGGGGGDQAGEDGGSGSASDGADGADGASDGADGTGEESNASITGTVRVQLYETDERGDISFIGWPSSYADAFPFGPIFIAPVRADLPSTGLYVGSGFVANPSPEGDTYTVNMNIDSTENVIIYGALDYWDNRIIHTTDPTGNHPQEITIRPGDRVEGVDFTILAPYRDFDGRTAAEVAVEDQADERSYCSDLTLSGEFDLTAEFFNELGGNGMAMIYEREGPGPIDWAEETLTATPGGATGTYTVQTCADQGYVRLVGRWDHNQNGIYDPTDVYGAYASTPGVESNPVAIGSSSLADYRIEAPLEEDIDGLDVVPFVRIAGTIGMVDGFDSLPAGSQVVVAATKYRMEGSIEIDDFDDGAYAYEVFEWPDLTGQAQVSWSLVVPANTVIYLWGFADENGDGVVNQEGEAVVSGGDDDNGRLNSSSVEGARNLTLTDFIGR